jgi:hypothetical protein
MKPAAFLDAAKVHPLAAGTPKQNGPSWAERSWGHLGGTSRVMVRDVRLESNHIRFAAAVQFCSLA